MNSTRLLTNQVVATHICDSETRQFNEILGEESDLGFALWLNIHGPVTIGYSRYIADRKHFFCRRIGIIFDAPPDSLAHRQSLACCGSCSKA